MFRRQFISPIFVVFLTLGMFPAIAELTEVPKNLKSFFKQYAEKLEEEHLDLDIITGIWGGKEALAYTLEMLDARINQGMPKTQKEELKKKIGEALKNKTYDLYYLGRALYFWDREEDNSRTFRYWLVENSKKDLVDLGGANFYFDGDGVQLENNIIQYGGSNLGNHSICNIVEGKALEYGWIKSGELKGDSTDRAEYMIEHIIDDIRLYYLEKFESEYENWIRFEIDSSKDTLKKYLGELYYNQMNWDNFNIIAPFTFEVRKTGERYFALYDTVLEKYLEFEDITTDDSSLSYEEMDKSFEDFGDKRAKEENFKNYDYHLRAIYQGKEALEYVLSLLEAKYNKMPSAQKKAIQKTVSDALKENLWFRYYLGRVIFHRNYEEMSNEYSQYFLLDRKTGEISVQLGGAKLIHDGGYQMRNDHVYVGVTAMAEYDSLTNLLKEEMKITDFKVWELSKFEDYFNKWLRIDLRAKSGQSLKEFLGSFTYSQLFSDYYNPRGHVIPFRFRDKETRKRYFGMYDFATMKLIRKIELK